MKLRLTNKIIVQMKEEQQYISNMAFFACVRDSDLLHDYEIYKKLIEKFPHFTQYEICIYCLYNEMLYRGMKCN